jgi:hypothetical protein
MENELIKSISLFKFYQIQLEKAVLFWQNDQALPPNIFPKKSLNLLRIRRENDLFYQSAIAFTLSNYYSISPVNIAKELGEILSQDNQQFTVKITLSGKIEFYPQDLFLGLYLQNIPDHDYFKLNWTDFSPINFSQSIAFHYLLDRCNQLLNLAHETNIIELINPHYKASFYQWKNPNILPFLLNDQLIFNHLAEKELIEKIIMIVDIPDQFKTFNLYRIGRSLGESFLNFDQKCQIWGETAKNHVKLSEGRLGLIALTQFILQWLLSKFNQG